MPDRPDNTHSSRTDDSTHSPTSPPPDCTTTPTRWSGSPETSLPRTSTSESPFSHASPSPSYLRQPSHHLPLSIILHVILVVSHFRLLSRLLFHRFRVDSIAQLQLPPPHFLQLALPLLHLPLQQRYASFSTSFFPPVAVGCASTCTLLPFWLASHANCCVRRKSCTSLDARTKPSPA